MFTDRARAASQGLVEPVVAGLHRARVSPNVLTVFGCLLHVGVAGLLALGHLRIGAIALAVAAGIDGLDGSLARRSGRVTRSGAFLDPLADKVLVLGAMFALVAADAMWWFPVAIIAVRV